MGKYKTCGQIFGQTPEDMEELHAALSAAGYEFAYIMPQSATIIKEVVTLEEPNEQSES